MPYELNKKIRELEPYEPISGTYKIRLDANECPENYPDFIKEEIKNAIIAEAYFHRAYWYYRLVHLYGDVPFLNIEHTAPKIDFYTHSRKTILAKIEEDLAWAVQWLPKTAAPGACLLYTSPSPRDCS